MSFHIVPIARPHIGQIVKLRTAAFPGFFLTFMGPRFLRVLYTDLLDNGD